jgi:chlorobactene glucosyltransferase
VTAIIIASTLLMGLGIVITWLLHNRVGMQIVVHPRTGFPEGSFSESHPLISVIIPARNEQRNIHRCIQALLSQTYPNYEIIVVDDHSTDETPQILSELTRTIPRLRVIQGSELPPGWAGKPHALVQGSAEAQGEWLCFMDADTFAEPGLLMSTYRAAINSQADMFSILTDQELGSFWERTVLPLVFLGLSYGFPAERVNDPTKPDAIANGQFILIKRSVYARVGGHTAVKDRIDEDKAIAVVVKHAGYRLVVADGRKVATTRMYTSLAEMWEGWTKNIYLGLRDRPGLLLFGILIGLVVSVVLPVWLVGGLAWLAISGRFAAGVVAAEAIVLWGYLLWKRVQASHAFSISSGYALTFPLGALIFTAMMVASAYDVLSGHGVVWKGRRYR